jgi:hypothetical protein
MILINHRSSILAFFIAPGSVRTWSLLGTAIWNTIISIGPEKAYSLEHVIIKAIPACMTTTSVFAV